MFKPKRYKFILWDVDDTLIDFKKSEAASLEQCFSAHNMRLSKEDMEVYSGINHKYWTMLERGEIAKNELLIKRFIDFGTYLNRPNIDAIAINDMFQNCLGDNAVLHEHGFEICQEIKGQCYQCAITNGTKTAQNKKLRLTKLDEIFDNIFISDIVGFEKPDVNFFNYCFERIPNFKKEDAIIIGDSQTSDIKGANNVGIDCCLFNFRKHEIIDSVKIDYTIESLHELREIL